MAYMRPTVDFVNVMKSLTSQDIGLNVSGSFSRWHLPDNFREGIDATTILHK